MFVRSTLLVLIFTIPFIYPPFRALAKNIERRELQLSIGEQRVIPSENVKSYSEGTPGVVDTRLTKDASQFVIVGQREGTSTLLFIMMDGSEVHYKIRVINEEPKEEIQSKEDILNRVIARDNIRLDFYFVQFSKAYRHQIGIGYPGAIGNGQISASFDIMSGSVSEITAVVADQVLPRLDMAQSQGWAKLMRQAAVISVNGSDASFSGGGEVNIPIQGALTAEVRKIEFGSHIKVHPRYDRDTGRIELKIHADVSDLAEESGTGIPGRVTSVLDTVVNLELGQSLVLAGLKSRNRASSASGLPGLSQIPILGVLFGTTAVRSQETENLIFIVPTVVDSVSIQARTRIREAMNIYQQYNGDIEEVPIFEPPTLESKTQPSQSVN